MKELLALANMFSITNLSCLYVHRWGQFFIAKKLDLLRLIVVSSLLLFFVLQLSFFTPFRILTREIIFFVSLSYERKFYVDQL